MYKILSTMFTTEKADTSTRTAICSAIGSKQLIELYYHGGYRIVEPFCLGVLMLGDADNESLLCYQVSGHSEFGDIVGWKLFRFSEISNLKVIDKNFTGVRSGYDSNKLGMATFYCCVSMHTDDEEKPKETIQPIRNSEEKERLSCDDHENYEEDVSPFQKHNESVKRFRLSHLIFPSRMIGKRRRKSEGDE